MSISKKFHHAIFEKSGNLVIFRVWLLINHMVNVTETFIVIFKKYFLQTNVRSVCCKESP